MIIHTMDQLSDEWFSVKRGKISASHMHEVMAGGTGKTRKNYMLKLIAERITGQTQESYQNDAMVWGTETEPLARQAYEMDTLQNVQQVGFVEINDFLGCSPDGFVGEDGTIQIKCPNTTTHLSYILDGKMPTDYIRQVQSELWMCDRQWCDFISFDPRCSVRPLFKVRVNRDEKKIEEIKSAVDEFICEMNMIIEKIKA